MDHPKPGASGAGEVIGQRYVLVRQLREEPWGPVWLAQDQLLEAEVGLKFLERGAPEWEGAQKLFAQEAVQALRLRHPQILGVYFLGQTDRVLYLVQEPFLGESLLAQLTRQHRFSLLQALQLLERLSQPLALAHRLRLVHRFLCPLNVLLHGDEVRLANFALPPADGDRVTHLELKAYDPPEVLQGEVLTPAGNVFSLGVLGFRLAVGSLPYPLTFDEPFPYRLEIPPVDLEEIPLALQNFLLQCLAEDPEERLPDAGAFLAHLRQVRDQLAPGRGETPGGWGAEKPGRGRQAAAQAAAWLGKVREASQPLGKKTGEGALASWRALKAAPRRLWLGLGLAALIIFFFIMGAINRSHRAVAPPTAPQAAALKPAAPAAGPPLVAKTEPPAAPAPPPATAASRTPPLGAPAPRPAVEAKIKPADQGRYLLLVATYGNQKQAQTLLKRLKARHYRSAKVVSRTSGAKTLYQVQVGPYSGHQAAEVAAGHLKEQEKITPKIMKVAEKTTKKSEKKTARKTTKKTGTSPAQRSTR
jgi:cell division septation protein DedD